MLKTKNGVDAMKIYLKDKGYVMTADFPMHLLEMQDILDRLGKV